MDYNMDHVLGNLCFQEYEALFRGDTRRSLLKALEEETVPSLCRKCSVAVGIGDREDVLTARVETLFLAGEIAAAMKLAGEMAKRYPDNPANWNNIGVILSSMGEIRDARECFRAALSKEPGHADALKNLNALEEIR
jgi:Flp pilus assembly protein TadD